MQLLARTMYGTLLSSPILDKDTEKWLFSFEEESTTTRWEVTVPAGAMAEGLLTDTQVCNLNVSLLEVQHSAFGLEARMVILDPSFMMDVSALSNCVRTYGTTHLNFILDRLQPPQSSLPMLLGNIANFFLDELLHEASSSESAAHSLTYQEAIRAYFRRNALDICITMRSSTPEEERAFFVECQRQFDNLRHCINQQFTHPSVSVRREDLLIEPSFFAPHLGLQGRIDALSNDYKVLFELKSGKAKEFGGRVRHQEPHYFQMLLYYLILRHLPNVSDSFVKAYLLYSRYPQLMPQFPSDDEAFKLLAVRNSIVLHDRWASSSATIDQLKEFFLHLSPELLNVNGEKGTLWMKYQRPDIAQRLQQLQQLPNDELLYLIHIYRFTLKELRASRLPLVNSDGHTVPYDRWHSSEDERHQQGALLQGLRLTSLLNEQMQPEEQPLRIGGLMFSLRSEELENSSFRVGDLAFIYPHSSDGYGAIRQEVMRGQIVSITRQQLLFSLHASQRRSSQFVVSNRAYCLEPDNGEANLNALFRGMAAFADSSAARRSLLLNGPTGTPQEPMEDASVNHTIQRAISTPDLFLLVGPPGSGKTNIALRGMVEALLSEGKSVLLLSYTNRAVDEICSMLDTLPALDYLRIGKPASCNERFHARLFEQRAAEAARRSECLSIIEASPVVVGTVSTLSSRIDLLRLKRFDIAIIDEATQIVEAQLLPLLSATSHSAPLLPRFIMIGDQRQLPAVVTQSEDDSLVTDPRLHAYGLTDLRQSLFERLYRLITSRRLFSRIGIMTAQGRMHPDISAFPAREFYNGFLRPLGLPHQQAPYFFAQQGAALAATISRQRLLFLPTEADTLNNNPKTNAAEAQQVAETVSAIIALYQLNALTFSPTESIGIITPYRSQVSLIRTAIEQRISTSIAEQLTIDTVERYQGSQREVIIYSFCVNFPYQLELLSNETTVEGQSIDRKLNVALTRAREHLILIGNQTILSHSPLFKKLIDEATHNE